MPKEIEEITEDDLIELWGVIGGTPHLFEYGKDELKHVLTTGECEMEYEFGGKTKSAAIGLQLDYYTMAAIVDKLRGRGFPAPIDAPITQRTYSEQDLLEAWDAGLDYAFNDHLPDKRQFFKQKFGIEIK